MSLNLLEMSTPPIVLQAASKIMQYARTPWVARKLVGKKKLHLACGSNVLDGWANVEKKGKGHVIGWDLTNRLPIRSDTVELIFCEHFIEHVTFEQARELILECYRILEVGGILRLSTPDLKMVIDEYLSGRTSEWSDVGFIPATPCRLVNEAFRNWGHKFVFDADELKCLLQDAGFRKVTRAPWRESMIPALKNLECRPFHGEIIFEATK